MPPYNSNQRSGAGAIPVRMFSGSPAGYQQLALGAGATNLTVPAGAVAAYITVSNTAIRYRDDGVAPTATTGIPVQPGGQLIYTASLATVQFIAQAAGAILDIAYYA